MNISKCLLLAFYATLFIAVTAEEKKLTLVQVSAGRFHSCATSLNANLNSAYCRFFISFKETSDFLWNEFVFAGWGFYSHLDAVPVDRKIN